MLNDLAVLEAEQVESNHRPGVTSDAFVSGMQQDELPVHECAVACYVGNRCARYFSGERPHSGKTVSEVRIMLYERFGKVSRTAVGSFLRKMSIMAWRAVAPKVSEVVLRSSNASVAAERVKLKYAALTIEMIAELPPAAKRLRRDIFMASSS